MKRALAWVFVCSLGLLLAGCGDGLPDPQSVETPQEATEAIVLYSERMLEVMQGITDVESAEKAAQELHELANLVTALEARMEEMPDPGPEALQAIAEEFEDRFRYIQSQLNEQRDRLRANPELAVALRDAMQAIGPLDSEVRRREELEDRAEQAFEQQREQAELDRQRVRQEHEQRIQEHRGQTRPGPAGGPRPRRSLEEYRAEYVERFGAENVVTVEFTDSQNQFSLNQLGRDLRDLSGATAYVYQNRVTLLAPIEDLQAFADSIPYGRVTSLDPATRTVHLSAE